VSSEEESRFNAAIERILTSASRKKLIVAGPGTGKTYLFAKLLQTAPGDQHSRLVLTFINNLKDDLSEQLSGLAGVYTLHAYCQRLLHGDPKVRGRLSAGFRVLPGLASLIKDDWRYLRGAEPPEFVALMRDLQDGEESSFYLERGDYYDAVDFDDSVYRVFRAVNGGAAGVGTYDLVLIDEYQDFNRLEASVVDALGGRSPIVIAGDDDQALFGQLRGASWDFIRSLRDGGAFDVFELPFCLRCPEVIVGAVNDVVARARAIRRLSGRIEKPFSPYGPATADASRRYPAITVAACSVQSRKANYFGQFIEEAIAAIPAAEQEEARGARDPLVLVIASNPYRGQVVEYLDAHGFSVDTRRDKRAALERAQGIDILSEAPDANLGWRIVLEFEPSGFAAAQIKAAAQQHAALVEVLPTDYRQRVLDEVRTWTGAREREAGQPHGENQAVRDQADSLKVTSFEGAKGLSAFHVFIVGMHDGELPRDPAEIQDIEICRFIVGLTRARRHCSLLYTGRFGGDGRTPSAFLSWIKPQRLERVRVDASHWREPR